jgi:hypothetical protein
MFGFMVMAPEKIPWEEMDTFQDRTIFQTRAWLEFLEVSQGVKPVVIEISRDDKVVGYFTGALFKKFGLRILGSSFPGWNTAYMGFNLLPDVPRHLVAPGLIEFVFSTLGCAHIEIYDKYLRFEDIQEQFPRARYRVVSAMVMDISGSEDTVFHRMDKNRRTNIRKAAKNGLVAEVAPIDSFVDDFYGHLLEVFKRKELPLAHSKKGITQLIENLAPTGGILLARVRDPETGLPIASGIFSAFNGTMYISGVAALGSQVHRHSSEALYWFAICYWRERGMTSFDMMGGGEYKRRYGAVEVQAHWIRVSRFGILMSLRDQAEKWMTRLIRFKTKYLNS